MRCTSNFPRLVSFLSGCAAIGLDAAVDVARPFAWLLMPPLLLLPLLLLLLSFSRNKDGWPNGHREAGKDRQTTQRTIS